MAECGGLTKQPLGGRKTFPFITASMVGVGIGSYAVTANLGVYLIEQYNVPPVDSSLISTFIGGPTNLAPIVGGLISDTCLSCSTVITLGCAAFSLGMLLFTLTASLPFLRPPPCLSGPCKPPANWQLGIFYAAIALMTIGQGGTRFTAAAMGAAQSDDTGDQATFFSWYVTGLYISSIIGITGIVYIQDNVGWITGFGLSAAISLFGLIFFLLGNPYYRKPKPNNNIFVHALCGVKSRAEDDEKMESCEDYYAKLEDGVAESKTKTDGSSSSLDETEIKLTEDHDFSTVLQLVPLMATGTIVSVYIGIQMNVEFLQALVMDRRVGSHFSIPIGSIYIFMLIGAMVSIPFLDHVIYPAYFSLTGKASTPLQRIGIGFLITVLAMVYGAVVESKRLDVLQSSSEPFSVLWLVPCLMLAGLGEALHFPGQLAFFFQEFPASLKGSGTAVNALQTGIGSFLSSAAIELIRTSTGWIQDDANLSRLDNVYWVLALMGLLNFGCFLVCARAYRRNKGSREI